MIHPYIDCARRLPLPKTGDSPQKGRTGDSPLGITSIVCETAEGIVHRLWEPLASKQRPPNAYAAKFSVPYCVAYAILHGNVGLDAFTDEKAADPAVAALAAKVGYMVDPDNPYPGQFTGHLRVTFDDGTVVEERQGHFRGGQHEPLTRADIEEKFRGNCAYGGWEGARADRWLAFARSAFDAPHIDLEEFRA